MAGYSGTPLVQKLGIKAGKRVATWGAPSGFAAALAPLPEDTRVEARSGPLPAAALDVVLLFVSWRHELVARLDEARGSLVPDGGLWLCWPKKAARWPTDLTEDQLREVVLPTGLVDNKVCAIDEQWSGLRFVWRRENRGRVGQ